MEKAQTLFSSLINYCIPECHISQSTLFWSVFTMVPHDSHEFPSHRRRPRARLAEAEPARLRRRLDAPGTSAARCAPPAMPRIWCWCVCGGVGWKSLLPVRPAAVRGVVRALERCFLSSTHSGEGLFPSLFPFGFYSFYIGF